MNKKELDKKLKEIERQFQNQIRPKKTQKSIQLTFEFIKKLH
jgi:hypothetical protein